MNIETKFEPEEPADVLPQPAYLKAGLEPLEDFAARAEMVENALVALEGATGTAARRAVTRLRKELDGFEPAVTFLGQVKSGKTTLVNAMAGWADLLPSDVNPWTSVVTSLHLTPGTRQQDISARFQMMDENEWDRLVQKGGRLGELAGRAGSEGELETIRQQIEALRDKSRRRLGRKFELMLGQQHEYGYFDKNLLERYICIGDDFADDDDMPAGDEQGRFADITRSADLYLNSTSKPFRMCLRDTPGVNDTFMMREQVTINAVRASRLCVVVLSAHQALTSVDLALIRMISSLQSRDVIIFVNRIDELSDPTTQIPEIEASIRQVLADQKGPEDAKIIFGSAYWANMALANDIKGIGEASSQALVNWADAKDDATLRNKPPAEIIWHVSGLPELNRCVSERVVEKLGNPQLSKVITSAVSIASGQQAANKVRVQGDQARVAMSMHEVRSELNALAEHHRASLLAKTDEVIASYQARADRAHINFIDRATHSLIAHLESKGDGKVWSYDPTGLRMLLKSAYSVFAVRAQRLAQDHYELAVVDIAELYFKAFGTAVEGIELNVPEVQEFPAPVTIAQTIALDFNDSWWVSWWRRTRGFNAFAKQFHQLVSAETEDFMVQLKTVQTSQIQEQLIKTLNAFFEQNRDIMIEISSSKGDAEGMQRICLGQKEEKRLAQIDGVIADLKYCANQSKLQGETT
ncbi:MAG: dynamin family protein [Roseobacter sp.]|jgi:signal recognition particle receptor subunit beta|nr:dynamin family protein [Roseobacter sp.]